MKPFFFKIFCSSFKTIDGRQRMRLNKFIIQDQERLFKEGYTCLKIFKGIGAKWFRIIWQFFHSIQASDLSIIYSWSLSNLRKKLKASKVLSPPHIHNTGKRILSWKVVWKKSPNSTPFRLSSTHLMKIFS